MNAASPAPLGPDALMACDIAQLEALFTASRDDEAVLRGLRTELRYRQSPRALALLNRIQTALVAGEPCGAGPARAQVRHASSAAITSSSPTWRKSA